MASPQQIRTTTTDLLNISHPIMLAGMNVAAGPKLAAAVTNAGGIGVIGGVGYTPDMLREQIAELKSFLKDKNAPFGVDLLIPQVGGSARKTNYDYTKGKLDELVTIIIDSGAKLFVSAVGVPPKHVVDRLHKAGIYYMNMIGRDDVDDDTMDNARPFLMGKAAAVTNERKSAKAIVDEMVPARWNGSREVAPPLLASLSYRS